jgi:DNA polymerase III delta prime subunit
LALLRAAPTLLQNVRNSLAELFYGEQQLAVEEIAQFICDARQPRASTAMPLLLMFAGPPSTGKTTAAMAFAELVNSADGRFTADVSELNGKYARHYYCIIQCNDTKTNAVNQLKKRIVDTIKAVHEHELAATKAEATKRIQAIPASFAEFFRLHAANAGAAVGAETPPPKHAVFFFDEFEKLGGRPPKGTEPKSAAIWTALMTFWTSGEVVFEDETFSLPPGWHPVILFASNLLSQQFSAAAGHRCMASPKDLVSLKGELEKEVQKTVLNGDSALASRMVRHTVCFFAYDLLQCRRIISRVFQAIATTQLQVRGHPLFFDLCTVEDVAARMAQSNATTTIRELKGMWEDNVSRAFTFALADIPEDANSSHAFCLSLRTEKGAITPRLQVLVDARVSGCHTLEILL